MASPISSSSSSSSLESTLSGSQQTTKTRSTRQKRKVSKSTKESESTKKKGGVFSFIKRAGSHESLFTPKLKRKGLFRFGSSTSIVSRTSHESAASEATTGPGLIHRPTPEPKPTREDRLRARYIARKPDKAHDHGTKAIKKCMDADLETTRKNLAPLIFMTPSGLDYLNDKNTNNETHVFKLCKELSSMQYDESNIRMYCNMIHTLVDYGADATTANTKPRGGNRQPLYYLLKSPLIAQSETVKLLAIKLIMHYLEKTNLGDNTKDTAERTLIMQVIDAIAAKHDEGIGRDSYLPLELLLQHGANPNKPNRHGVSPVSFAIRATHGVSPVSFAIRSIHGEAIGILLRHGADPNAMDEQANRYPIQQATYENLKDVVLYLLNHGANINAQDEDDKLTPLMIASRLGHEETTEFLLLNGADIHMLNHKGENTLHMALMGKEDANKTIIRKLLNEGSDVSTVSESGATPLDFAHKITNAEIRIGVAAQMNRIVETLMTSVDSEGDQRIVYARQRSATLPPVSRHRYQAQLISAVKACRPKSVAFALYHGANPDRLMPMEQGAPEQTLLFHTLVCRKGRPKIPRYETKENILAVATLLLQYGADPNTTTPTQTTSALRFALNSNDLDVMTVFLTHAVKANWNLRSKDGMRSPLSVAIHLYEKNPRKDMSLIEKLLSNGANPSLMIGPSLSTVLMTAAENGHVSVVSACCDKVRSEDIDITDRNGNTALLRSCMAFLPNKNPSIIQSIIDQGANVNITNNDDENPLFLSMKYRNLGALVALLEHGNFTLMKFYLEETQKKESAHELHNQIKSSTDSHDTEINELLTSKLTKRERRQRKPEHLELKARIREISENLQTLFEEPLKSSTDQDQKPTGKADAQASVSYATPRTLQSIESQRTTVRETHKKDEKPEQTGIDEILDDISFILNELVKSLDT